MSETTLMSGLVIFLVIAFVVKDWFHRSDLRTAMDGISSYMKEVQTEVWNQSQFEVARLRDELETAQAKVLGLKRRAAPSRQHEPEPMNRMVPPSSNGRTRRKDLDHATIGGGV